MKSIPLATSRICAICGSSDKSLVYRQRFTGIAAGGLTQGYSVVVCDGCGFGYADEIPGQTELDRYYKKMSKYENEHIGGQVSSSTLATYQSIVRQIVPYLPDKSARILDVGCATAALLSLLKREGYTEVIGLDPSASCARTARRLYGINVLNRTLSEVVSFEAPFDFIILNSVLEHIRDLDGSLATMSKMLRPHGMMWVEVPDTSRFPQYALAPFQQFSLEHINYFSSASLANLMRKHGFESIAVWQNDRVLETVPDPALSTILRKGNGDSGVSTLVFDAQTKTALTEYVATSAHLDECVQRAIDAIASSGVPIVVWGVGTHTQRLLSSSRLAQANIRAFVDSNVRYHGMRLNGIPIVPPPLLRDLPEPILISSRLYQEEIAAQIRETLHLANEIIRLY